MYVTERKQTLPFPPLHCIQIFVVDDSNEEIIEHSNDTYRSISLHGVGETRGLAAALPSSIDRETQDLKRNQRSPGFEPRDLVHLLGLVCPDFPEEMVGCVSTVV